MSKTREEDKKVELIWDKELTNYEIPEKEWIVEKLIPNKAVGVWTGKRGSFKTFLTLTMAANASQGTNFLDHYPTKKCNVLYLDKENGIPIMKSRVAMIKKGMNIKDELDMAYICFSQVKIDKNLDIWAIEEAIKQHDIGLLIIDTYRRAISFDENSAGDVSRLFVDILRPIVERNDCSIVLIHHDRKGQSEGDEMDMIRGSSDLANYCDFILKNERKGKRLVLKQLKLRHGAEIEPISIGYQTDESTYFKFNNDGTFSQKTVVGSYAEKILIWIETSGVKQFKTSELQTFVFGGKAKKTNLHSALKDIESQGLIEHKKKGVWEVLRVDNVQNTLKQDIVQRSGSIEP
jgi:RecA-family ATPase